MEEDYQENQKKAVENNIIEPDPYKPLSKEEWLETEKKESNHWIECYRERIQEEKNIVKKLQERDKIIKDIFKVLEPYDMEK